MMKKGVLLIFVLLCLTGSACKKPKSVGVLPDISSQPSPAQTWIDAPLPNANIPLQPYKIVFHGASPGGVTEFEVRINGVGIATVPATPSNSGGADPATLYLGEYLWSPLAPGTYLIEVLSGKGGEFSAPDQVRVTITGEDIEVTDPEGPTPTATPTATATPTSTATPEEVEACMLTALVNLFCRPGTGYEPVDSFTPGQTAPVIGQSQWLWKVIGANNGVECTVPKDDTLVEVTDDCDRVPTFNPLPTPTATATSTLTPTATPTEKPVEGCTVRQPGGAIDCVVPCPAGAAPGNPCTP